MGLTETTSADWDRVMAVKIRAHFLALQAAVTKLEPGSAITFAYLEESWGRLSLMLEERHPDRNIHWLGHVGESRRR